MSPKEYVAELTPRELEALILTAKGFGPLQISRQWGTTRHNVHVTLHSVYRKFEVGSACEASVVAAQAGLLGPLDCRLCSRYTTASGGCVSLVRCVDGAQFRATTPKRYWMTEASR